MNYINYINILLIPGAYALTYAPVTFPLLIGLIAALAVISFTFTTISQFISFKRINRKDRVIASLEGKRLQLLDQKEELEQCIADKTQTQPYQNLVEINNNYAAIIEEQTKEIKDMKTDIEKLYESLKNINIDTDLSKSYSRHLDGLPEFFEQKPKPKFAEQRRRKSSIGIHRKRLGMNNQEEEELINSM